MTTSTRRSATAARLIKTIPTISTAGADKDNDDLETTPNDADCDCDCDCEDAEDTDEENEKDEKAVKKARDAGHARALKAVARTAARRERMRCSAIFQSGHSSGRIELAANLAFSSTMSARDAIATLAGSPRERIGNFTMTPGQTLMQATLRLVDRAPGIPRSAMPPDFAAERARVHKIERAEERIKLAGGTKAGLGLLKAVASMPPRKSGFGFS